MFGAGDDPTGVDHHMHAYIFMFSTYNVKTIASSSFIVACYVHRSPRALVTRAFASVLFKSHTNEEARERSLLGKKYSGVLVRNLETKI